MKYLPITLGGNTVELHGEKLLWIPALKLLCASDIHFEKGSFFRRFGSLLPPYDTEETLHALEQAVARFQPEHFVALGDSFHDVHAQKRLQPAIETRLLGLIASVKRWIWITGNHDPTIDRYIPGERMEELCVGGLWLRHQHVDNNEPEISGHYHPKVRLNLSGSRISSACFVQAGHKLIVPAYGSYTGGLHIDDAAFLEVLPQAGRRVFFTYRDEIYALKNN